MIMFTANGDYIYNAKIMHESGNVNLNTLTHSHSHTLTHMYVMCFGILVHSLHDGYYICIGKLNVHVMPEEWESSP